MAVQFVLGRAGAGKTEHGFESIEAWMVEHGLGGSAILITPRQATQVAERQLVLRKPGRSLLGVRVVSPEWLVREIAPQLAESLDLLDGRGRRLLIALAIQEHASELRYFVGADRQPHLAARIDAALAEIEQSGASLTDVHKGIEKLGSSTQKLADLSIIHAAYLRLLGERLDQHRLDACVLEAIESSPLIAHSLIVVDGFADFAPMQRKMMVALGKRASRMEIALLLDGPGNGGSDLFERTRRTYQRLHAEMVSKGVRVEPPLVLKQVRRFASPELSAIDAGFDTTAAYDGPPSGSVRLIEAATDLEEVRFAAEQVRRWQISGARLRDIGIFCRDLEPYAQWVRPIFDEYGIPCFVDQQRSLCEHPLMRYVRSALRIAMDGWRRPSVLDLLKCGMSPLDPHEVDRLENFALRHGIDRRQWLADWEFLKPPVREDEEPEQRAERLGDGREAEICSGYRGRAVDAIRSVTEAWDAGERVTARKLTDALRSLVAGDCVRRRLRELAQGAGEEEKEAHQQCVKALDELFDACDRLLGATELPRRHVAEMLLSAMEEMSVKLAPPTLDQVLVAQIDRSRSPNFTRVIVMGMNEGTFPARSAEDSVFSDAERKALDAAGIELNADSESRAIAEQLVGYIAMTRASHELVLTRPRTDEAGRKLAPSGFVGRIKKILPGLQEHPATLTPNPKAAIAQQEAADYDNEPQLDPAVAAELLGTEMACSPTRLELFAQCPFRHFLERSLRLKEREIAEVSSLDLGNAFHLVLEKLARKMIAEKLDWDSDTLVSSLEGLIEEVANELRGQVILSSARNMHLREVIKNMLLKLIADQRLLAASGYRVADTELVFGEREGSLPALEVKTPKGRIVRLRGRIDRVDRLDVNGHTSYLVFDYKSSARSLQLQELEEGISLQLMIYWLVMQENGRPVDAAFYQQLMRPMQTTKAPEVASAEEVRCKPRGLIDYSAKDRLDPQAQQWSKLYSFFVSAKGGLGNETSSDAVQPDDLKALQQLVRSKIGKLADAIFDGRVGISPYQIGKKSPCPYCPYRAACRFDTRYNEYRIIEPTKRTQVLDRANPDRLQQTALKANEKGKRHD